MTIFYEERFEYDISEIVEFISQDSIAKGKKFAREIRQAILKIPSFPYKHRQSIYFKDDTIRDLIYKGYVIAYMIDEESESITILGITKYKEKW
jgi:plasmid stabilization system protein ParE